jgi:hypothetical protein
MKKVNLLVGALLAIIGAAIFGLNSSKAQYPPLENPQTGSIGIQGIIATPPPSVGATITIPDNGQRFTNNPITVAGTCPSGLLVKVFKNNVFAGSVQCEDGSFSMQIDLFPGLNDLVARVYDDLDQAGPDSNIVTVTLEDGRPGASSRVTLSSPYAKRGANPGQTLKWPVTLSGGRGPYAISVDWGDGKQTDLFTLQFPGNFTIEHIYDNPGIYRVIVRATDADGVTAFLQLVAVANGTPGQGQENNLQVNEPEIRTRVIWEPAALAIPFIISTFWLGKRYELRLLRQRIARGENPFQ